MKAIEQAYKKAIEVLETCSRPTGFFASGLPGGYEAVWARDSMITSLGALTLGDKFNPQVIKSLNLLARNQSYLGQIPNCVGSYNLDRKSDVTFNTVDSSLWYLIGLVSYLSVSGDKELKDRQLKNLQRAYLWLSYQDPDEVRLIAQQPTMDWMDAFPHKYGYCINTHALYFAVLSLIGKDRLAGRIKKIINGEIEQYLSLYDKKLGYYYPWGWKNHDNIREHEEWFDSLGNILAVVTGLATPAIAKQILNFIDKDKINRPYPCKTIYPTLRPGDKEWHDYFANCDAREADHYLNGGIWPFIGGFYVVALVKMKQFKKAEQELELLAQANLQTFKDHNQVALQEVAENLIKKNSDYKKLSLARVTEKLKQLRSREFNECLNGKTGEPTGEPFQAWSAGAFLYAHACLKKKKVLFFDY